MKKIGATWVIVIFVVGVLLGTVGGAAFVTWKVMRFEADAVTQSVAENAMGVMPALLALGGKDVESRIDKFEKAARIQIIGSIVAMHFSLRFVTEEKGKYVEGVLRHIAANRAKLKVGMYGDPVRNDIEEILKEYAE